MQQHCQQQPENHFYQAALLLWKPRRNTFCVTPNWRKRWRQLHRCPASRRAADYCGDLPPNAQHKPQTFWQACQLFWYMKSFCNTNPTPVRYRWGASTSNVAVLSDIINPGRRCGVPERLLESLWVKCNDIVLLRSTSRRVISPVSRPAIPHCSAG